jgi:cyclopropane-fatty-acyl-phospholipid synthase
MSAPSIPVRRGSRFGSLLEPVAWRIGLAAAERIRVGHLTAELPDGSRIEFGDPNSTLRGEIRIHDSAALVRMLLHGETGGGEAYVDGLWSSPDLPALLRVAASNRAALALSRGWYRLPSQLARTLAHRTRRNTKRGSRRNISAHYDLGNDFYRLFLDASMTYSSAVFTGRDQTLEEAQRDKYAIMAAKAGLAEGMHVLEIGTGWGGFAIHAAREIGCRVTSITVSRAQYDLARDRVRAAGLDHLVDVQLRDYREIEGTYDAIVSIEMLEAVGAEYLATFFSACDKALRPGGRMSVQVITFPDDAYERQLRGANWIQTYIFPGGVCPSLAAIERATSDTQLLLTGVTDIAASYVRTLSVWRERFLARLDDVRAMDFDERFIRMWEYYLALSEAGFATGFSQDLQIVFERRRGLADVGRPAARA